MLFSGANTTSVTRNIDHQVDAARRAYEKARSRGDLTAMQHYDAQLFELAKRRAIAREAGGAESRIHAGTEAGHAVAESIFEHSPSRVTAETYGPDKDVEDVLSNLDIESLPDEPDIEFRPSAGYIEIMPTSKRK